MKRFTILASILWVITLFPIMGQTKVIAHRGFWNCPHSAQNSLTSLFKADEAHVFGSEFDVIITKDNVPIIHHDDSINHVLIENANFEEIRNNLLENGESVPTLEQYLHAGILCPQTKLILEIKPHYSITNENRAVKKTLELVRKYNMEKQIYFISFSMNVCEELHKNAPNASIAYLKGDIAPKEIAKKGLTGIDYQYEIIYKHPEWIKEAHNNGLDVNVWTVNTTKDIKRLNKMGVDYITTNNPIEALQILK